MAVGRPLISLLSIAILAGGIVLQFFVILSGATNGSPEGKVYFLQTDTNNIVDGRANIPNPARWTYFAICGEQNGHNANCLPKTAALPYDPPRNFATDRGIPAAFLHTHHYYYLSRVAWSFYLIALFFAAVALLLSVFALCARLGSYLTGFTTFFAVLCQGVAAGLMTAWTIQARDHWKAAGGTAKVGEYAYGFTWGAFAAFFLSAVLFCVGGGMSSDSGPRRSRFGRFGRTRSTRSNRSRGSFHDTNGAGRVKDDYE